MKNFQKTFRIQHIYLDWKEFSDEAFKDFQRKLKKLGIYMYEDPTCEGSDTYGIILAYNGITKQQLKDYCAYRIGYKSWKHYITQNLESDISDNLEKK